MSLPLVTDGTVDIVICMFLKSGHQAAIKVWYYLEDPEVNLEFLESVMLVHSVELLEAFLTRYGSWQVRCSLVLGLVIEPRFWNPSWSASARITLRFKTKMQNMRAP